MFFSQLAVFHFFEAIVPAPWHYFVHFFDILGRSSTNCLFLKLLNTVFFLRRLWFCAFGPVHFCLGFLSFLWNTTALKTTIVKFGGTNLAKNFSRLVQEVRFLFNFCFFSTTAIWDDFKSMGEGYNHKYEFVTDENAGCFWRYLNMLYFSKGKTKTSFCSLLMWFPSTCQVNSCFVVDFFTWHHVFSPQIWG